MLIEMLNENVDQKAEMLTKMLNEKSKAHLDEKVFLFGKITLL